MTTSAFLSYQMFIVSTLSSLTFGIDYQPKERTAVLRLSKHCQPLNVRLDEYDKVRLKSSEGYLPNSVVPGNLTCAAHFLTTRAEQGICVENHHMSFKNSHPGIKLKIFTSYFGPEMAFDYFHSNDTSEIWCTTEPLVSVELTSARDFHDHHGGYEFSFSIKNLTREAINRHYRMDSFKDCNRSYNLKSGEKIRISLQEYPSLADLPSLCQVTFSAKSEEEFEELCLQIKEHSLEKNCLSSLAVSGFNSRFWPETEVLGCNDTHPEERVGKEMCSSGKTLTLTLTRTSSLDTGVKLTAAIEVKRHPYWQLISQEQHELRGLGFVKGLTYFVAIVDSLAGIVAAILTNMFRRPRSFWKSWAESVKVPQKCESVHYEDSYPEVSSSKVEEITEVKSY